MLLLVTGWASFHMYTPFVSFLCELPILKYIFGTTTTNQEKTYYFVTARAVPVAPDDSIPQGVLKAFDELAKQ